MMYISDDINHEKLHWLSLISCGYFLWHSLKVIFIDKSAIYGWYHVFAFVMALICVKDLLPDGIVLILGLIEIPNIFLNTCVVIRKKYKYFRQTIIYTACNFLFVVTWFYFRLWLVFPLVFKFAYFNDVWQLRTPQTVVYTVRVCVLAMILLHIFWTCEILLVLKNTFFPSQETKYNNLLMRLYSINF